MKISGTLRTHICALLLTIVVFRPAARAQLLDKIYLNPEIGLGIVPGYDNGLDFGNTGRALHLELRGGYKLDERISLFTGFGFWAYRYQLTGRAALSGPDTIRSEFQDCFEVPLGVRFCTYHGHRSFRTRFYGAAGLRLCFQDDIRHDYRTTDGSGAGQNVVRPEDFNPLWVRLFAEGGLDIPMDYGSAILIGLNISDGLSRNMNSEGALARDNYGVLLIGGSIGIRFSLH